MHLYLYIVQIVSQLKAPYVMQSIVALFIVLLGLPAVVQSDTVAAENPWRSYSFIALGAIVLIITVMVLIRKQHRKFNE